MLLHPTGEELQRLAFTFKVKFTMDDRSQLPNHVRRSPRGHHIHTLCQHGQSTQDFDILLHRPLNPVALHFDHHRCSIIQRRAMHLPDRCCG